MLISQMQLADAGGMLHAVDAEDLQSQIMWQSPKARNIVIRKRKVHNLLVFQRSYGLYEVREKTLIRS